MTPWLFWQCCAAALHVLLAGGREWAWFSFSCGLTVTVQRRRTSQQLFRLSKRWSKNYTTLLDDKDVKSRPNETGTAKISHRSMTIKTLPSCPQQHVRRRCTALFKQPQKYTKLNCILNSHMILKEFAFTKRLWNLLAPVLRLKINLFRQRTSSSTALLSNIYSISDDMLTWAKA